RRTGLGTEEAGERIEDAVEHRNGRYVQGTAALVQGLAQVRRNQGVDDHAGQRLDHAQHLVDLRAVAHERPDVLDRNHPLELSHACARHSGHDLTRRVRYEMKMHAQRETLEANCGQTWHARADRPYISRLPPAVPGFARIRKQNPHPLTAVEPTLGRAWSSPQSTVSQFGKERRKRRVAHSFGPSGPGGTGSAGQRWKAMRKSDNPRYAHDQVNLPILKNEFR